MSVKVVVAERFIWLSVPVSIRVYLPAGATGVVEFELEFDVPGELPQPLTPKLNSASKSITPNIDQRRRFIPGSPSNISPASAAPEIGAPRFPPAPAPELLRTAAARPPLIPAQALFEVYTVTEPLVAAVGFT